MLFRSSEQATAFEKLSTVFQKHQVYMEIAVPTMIKMLDLSEKSEKISGVDIGFIYGEERAQNDGSLFWRYISRNISYIRPVVLTRKYSAEKNSVGMVEVLLNRFNHTNCSNS